MGEGLGKVADLFAAGADLFGVEHDVIGVGEHLLQRQLGVVEPYAG